MNHHPLISVVVPVYNGGAYLEQCLDALLASCYTSREIIVIDDGSTDDSGEASRHRGARVHRLSQRSGPAAARNEGVSRARGQLILFVDADVLVRPDTLRRIADTFHKRPDVSAVFGSYDDSPAATSLVSQYKNLFHHFIHQRAEAEASTFWAGCGAIRRKAFDDVGGFDAARFPEPSIEDVELGYRLRACGHRILLDKELQVTHLKRWSLKSLLHTDIFRRAVPWSKLILEDRRLISDLNLKPAHRLSTALVALTLASLVFAWLDSRALYVAALLLSVIIYLNRELYLFFVKRRGVAFAVGAFPLHLLYYLYSGAIFASCWCAFVLKRGKSVKPIVREPR